MNSAFTEGILTFKKKSIQIILEYMYSREDIIQAVVNTGK